MKLEGVMNQDQLNTKIKLINIEAMKQMFIDGLADQIEIRLGLVSEKPVEIYHNSNDIA